MPIYDYTCTNSHVVEVVHGVHEARPSVCPRCGAPMRKRLAAPAIHFRGSGWARNDARAAAAGRGGGGHRHKGDHTPAEGEGGSGSGGGSAASGGET